MYLDITKPAVGERITQLVWRSGKGREGPVVDRDDLADTQQLDRQRGFARAHRVQATDGQEGDIRPVQLADEAHVAEDVRVAGVVDAKPVLELGHETCRLA